MTNEEFYTNVLVPAVTNLGLGGDITTEKLRWLRDEIDLYLGEYVTKPVTKPESES